MNPGLCKRRSTCRLCGSHRVEKAIELTPTPPANAFIASKNRNEPQSTFPLDVYFCRDCTHAQLLDVVDPSHLFENYVYVSGTSQSFVDHFRAYAEKVVQLVAGRNGQALKVLDIGSNDGTLLNSFKTLGCDVLGIDPAHEIAETATQAGIPTIAAFFNESLAEDIWNKYGAQDIVTANNVFAHADDMEGIARGIAHLLSDEGVFVFEVSYLGDVIANGLFDTIYHEHLAYHAVAPLVPFFECQGLCLIDVQHVKTHGGSLRGIVARSSSSRNVTENIAKWISRERDMGLNRIDTYHAFQGSIDAQRKELTELVSKINADGESIAGFGAPAKATTLMYHFGIGPEVIDFIVDDSPLKQGLLTPGYHIPVVPSAHMYKHKPDYVLILAWNFSDPIIRNHQKFLDDGGKFIVPIPKLRIISA